jgi:hypothetical protein
MNEEKLLILVNMAVMFFRAKLEPNVMLSYIRDEFQNMEKKKKNGLELCFYFCFHHFLYLFAFFGW